jgi:hypothetical protein
LDRRGFNCDLFSAGTEQIHDVEFRVGDVIWPPDVGNHNIRRLGPNRRTILA